MMKILLPILLLVGVGVLADEPRHETVTKLKQQLLMNYDAETIPSDSKMPVQVEVSLSMMYMDLNDKGELEFTAYCSFKWQDKRLSWKKEDFGDLNLFRMQAKHLWIPDIEVFNAIDFGPGSFSDTMRKKDHAAIVYSTGDVIWIPPVNGKVQCNDQEFSHWPWGEYDCSIVMGSWTFDGFLLNTTLFGTQDFIRSEKTVDEKASPMFFTENSFNETAWKNAFYDCCPDEPYPKLDFRFKVQRSYLMTEGGKVMNPSPKKPFDYPKEAPLDFGE